MSSARASDYGDRHRAFLQAFFAHATLSFAQAQPVLAAILNVGAVRGQTTRPEQITFEMFSNYVDVAAEAASQYDYEIRTIVDQVTGDRIYALVNTQSDPQTQLATTFSAEELAFIKRVLDGMFDVYNTPRMEAMAVTEMQAIKFARPPNRRPNQMEVDEFTQAETQVIDRGLKHSEVEAVLARLVNAGWFGKSRHGFYSLTARAILELRPWLVETYNDAASADAWQRIKFCEACKEIVTYGLRCSEPDCVLRLHDMCQDAFWRARRANKCPNCQKDWQGDQYAGERAVTKTEAYRRGRRTNGAGRGSLADEVMHGADVGNDEDEEEE